jgi:hypothetical protein
MPFDMRDFLIPLAVVLMQKTTHFFLFPFLFRAFGTCPPKVVYFLLTLLRYVDAALDMLAA